MLSNQASHPLSGQNNAADNLRPLEIIMPLLRQLAGVELAFDQVAEVAVICLDKIGNTRRARFAVEVDVREGFAELPVNCERIEAVLVPGAGWQQHLGDVLSQRYLPREVAADQIGGSYRLSATAPIDPHQTGERFTDFTFRDGGLYVGRQASYRELVQAATGLGRCSPVLETVVDEGGNTPRLLHVFYQGSLSDERGFPLITPEEALACAYFVLSVETQKKVFAREADANQYQLAKSLSDQHINQARVAPLGSSNALDKVLDESKRYHRHFFTDDLRVS